MNEAGTTWALVVGIDQYDDPGVRPLKGAVADALAAVSWLRRLGVPDEQILLHASPSSENRPALESVRPRCPAANSYDIDKSIVRLEKVSGGSRLFVFLMGHGLYEATSGPLFLTQDFTQSSAANMGIMLYVQRFLAMGFRRQFLFLDGCQNLPYSQSERQKITGAMYGGRTGFTPKPGNTLVACYAAAQDQLANEVGGKGLFSRYLFDGLNVFRPLAEHSCPEVVDLDFEAGIMTLDLSKLIYRYVQPSVQSEASQQPGAPVQTPQLLPHGFAGSERHPVIRLPDPKTVAMEFLLDPTAAVKDIRELQIMLQAPYSGTLRLPAHAKPQIAFPVVRRLPSGAQGMAVCSVRPGASWNLAKAYHVFEGTGDLRLTFRLWPATSAEVLRPTATRGGSASGGDHELGAAAEYELPDVTLSTAAVVKLRTVSADGLVMSDMFDYNVAARQIGLPGNPGEGEEIAPGVSIFHHETGPDLQILEWAVPAGRRAVRDWTKAIQDCTPPEIGVLAVVPPELKLDATLRVIVPPGGAGALAGVLAALPSVWIGPPDQLPSGETWRKDDEGILSLRDLEAKEKEGITVDPGPLLFRLDLPWGSWTRTVWVPPAGDAELKLPEVIGTPPLRVALRCELEWGETLILGSAQEKESEVLDGQLRCGLTGAESLPLALVDAGTAAWALRPSRPLESLGERWNQSTLAEISGSVRAIFPLLTGRALGVSFAGGGLRVEPLSSIPLASWDLLVASGRLDALGSDDAVALLAEKKADPLLALAAAYVVHASPGRYTAPFLNRVLRHLGRLTDELPVPDLDLLHIALSARKQRRKTGHFLSSVDAEWFEQVAAPRLEGWAQDGSVPILRWGVPMAIQILSLGEQGSIFAAWRESLTAVERRLSRTSVWTAWVE